MGMAPTRGQRGRPRPRLQGLSGQGPYAVRAVAPQPPPTWPQGEVRHTARGRLPADFAGRRLWPVAAGQRPRAEGWVIRRHRAGDGSSTRLHAPTDTPQAGLRAWRCRRSCTARPFEEAKTESGWDAFQAQQYRAWEQPWALTAAAWWFVAPTTGAWAQLSRREPARAHQVAVAVLPALSTANVREVWKAGWPWRQLTPAEAMALVMTHLSNRARSTSRRLKSQAKPHDSS